MRKAELTTQQLETMLASEKERLQELFDARRKFRNNKDIEAFELTRIQIQDVIEEIKHLENKLHPYQGTCPHCVTGHLQYGHNYVRCDNCGSDGNPTPRKANE